MVMKSKTSFINTGILRNDFKRYGWIGVVYLLALLAMVPLQLVMKYFRPEEIKAHYNAHTYLQILQFDYSPVTLILLLIVPVLTGLLLFRYLQSGKAADMEHTLPIRRETLYNTHLLAGLIFLFVPIILTALLSWAVVSGLRIDFVQDRDIVAWLIAALLGNLLFFMSAVAVGMFTGLSTLQGLLTYILLLVPSGLTFLLVDNLRMYVYGFPCDYYALNLEKLSPLLRLPMSGLSLQNHEIIMYLLISLAVYFVGRYLYRRRQVEMAGDAITFEVLRPIFKYSVTFCTMLLVGSYFYSSQQSMAWTYFGYFLGAALGYVLIEILLNKSLYVFDRQRFKGLGIYSLVVIGLIALLYTDITAYEKRLPEMSQVENIYMDRNFHALLYADDPGRPAYRRLQPPIYAEKDNITHIMDLHREIIAHRGEEKGVFPSDQNSRPERICLAYQLKNGKRFYRYYDINAAFYQEHLKPIYESREYKTHQYEALRLNPGDIKLVDIRSRDGNKHVSIADPKMIQQAVNVLQNDIYAQSYEEMTSPGSPWGYIEITLPKEKADNNDGSIWPEAADRYFGEVQNPYYNISLSWQKSYVNFEQWMQSMGLYEKARLLPGEDVIHAIIEYAPQGLNESNYRIMKATGEYVEEKPGQLKITAPDKLEICLRNYQDQYTKGPLYKVIFQLKNGTLIFGILTPATAPDFVKQHFVG
jgi:ABC-2 type transport system permease protein